MAQTIINKLTEGVASAEQFHVTRLTTTQIRALNATPRTIIPAPGAGKIIIPGRGIILSIGAGTVFSSVGAGDDLTFQYDGGAVNPFGTVETTGFLSVATAQTRLSVARSVAAVVPAVNTPVEITNSGALTGGRTGLVIVAYYYIVEL